MISPWLKYSIVVIGSVYWWNRKCYYWLPFTSPLVVWTFQWPVKQLFFPFLFSSNVTPQLKNRRLSEPVSPLPSELPPAIPAILSKAKGLLKKKLKSPVDDQLPSLFQSSSPTPPPLEESLVESAKENTARPLEVEELIQCSAKTRYLVLSYRLV